MLIFAALIMHTEQQRCRAAAVICAGQHAHTVGKCAKQIFAMVAFSFSPVSLPPSKSTTYLSFQRNPWYRLFPEDRRSNLAAFLQQHLPWGIKGWLSCNSLSQWDYLLPNVAFYDTWFHTCTLLLDLSHHLSLFFPLHVQPALPSYSRKATLYWREGECQEFFQHFYWLRVIVVPARWLAWRHTLTVLLVWLLKWLLICANWLMSFDFQATYPLANET